MTGRFPPRPYTHPVPEQTRIRPTVAILGAGAMGEALLRGLRSAGWTTDEVSVAARRPERAAAVEAATGQPVVLDPVEAVGDREVVVVATKPRDVTALLDQVEKAIRPPQIVVSVAAGVPIRVFEERLPGVAVIRAMPNTPALVGEGVTGIAAGTHADDDAIDAASAVLGAVGVVRRMEESNLDAVTAVSGTGPAYVFLLAEALMAAGREVGLPPEVADALTVQTLLGAATLLARSGDRPEALRAAVTSPNGTTQAGIEAMEAAGFRAAVTKGVDAATKRSRELGQGA